MADAFLLRGGSGLPKWWRGAIFERAATLQQATPPRRELGDQIAINAAHARHELASCLSRQIATLPPKYFYDTQGSKLFEAICELDEYYLTRTEARILSQNLAAIAQCAGADVALIDLGAGNCAKAFKLLARLRARHYVPVDISTAFLREAVKPLAQAYPDLAIHPVALDFSERFVLPAAVQALPNKLFFYPGSSLGNFSPVQARLFLETLRAAGGDLLIGLDLVKPAAMLEAAYDDALGVTAAFNRNALRQTNHLLGSDFDLASWRHKALFNADHSRVEMHLQAATACHVSWPGGGRDFAAGETIHTENCYKFTRTGIEEMLHSAGFSDIACWSDPDDAYLVCHARAG